jgi:hypothetical protein
MSEFQEFAASGRSPLHSLKGNVEFRKVVANTILK